MFGLFKPKLAPEGPHVFAAETEIDAPIEEVFALIDYADPRHAHVARGGSVTALDQHGQRFLLKVPQVADLDFHIDVIAREAPHYYSYTATIQPLVGRMGSAVETYTVSALPGGGCKLHYENAVTFQPGTRMKELEREYAMCAVATLKGVHKLKLQAEQGVEAVLALG